MSLVFNVFVIAIDVQGNSFSELGGGKKWRGILLRGIHLLAAHFRVSRLQIKQFQFDESTHGAQALQEIQQKHKYKKIQIYTSTNTQANTNICRSYRVVF